MTNQTNSVVKPDILNENKMTIHSFLRESYNQARKQWDDGVSFIQDGVTFFKDEFSALYDKTGQYLNRMALPINNFLKEFTQIDSELRQEMTNESSQLISLGGQVMPVDQVLKGPLEENY